MKNELAILAIKGGRYLEAEKMFNKEVKKKPSYNSYFGLGICKINLLLDSNRSVDEVIYCFEKSLSLVDNQDKIEIENQVFEITLSTLTQFKELYLKLEQEKRKQSNAALAGLALSIGAAAIGSSSNSNAFTQIASLAVAGAGVGVSLEGLSNLGEIPEIQNYILKTSREIINKSKNIIETNDFQTKIESLRIEEWSKEKSNINSTNSKPSLSSIMTPSGQLQFTKYYLKKIEDIIGQKPFLILLATFGLGLHRILYGKVFTGILYLISIGGFFIWMGYDVYKIMKNEFDVN